jgi:hypothetical protein
MYTLKCHILGFCDDNHGKPKKKKGGGGGAEEAEEEEEEEEEEGQSELQLLSYISIDDSFVPAWISLMRFTIALGMCSSKHGIH